MKRFVAKLLAFGLLQMLVLCALVWRNSRTSVDFMAASIDKHRRADAVAGPRLFLVGGSNVAFGIHSPLLHERLDYYPINLALHAGLGLPYMLNEALDVVRPGDVVILSPEYEHYLFDPSMFSVIENCVKRRPASLGYLNWEQHKRLLDLGLVRLREMVHKTPREFDQQDAYTRSNFNEYGDFVGHHAAVLDPQRAIERQPKLVYNGRRLEQMIAEVNAFAAACRRRGVDVYYSQPPLLNEDYRKNQSVLDRLTAELERQLEFPILNSGRELLLPRPMFYDTYYHLTLPGKQLRARLLADRLQQRPELAVRSIRPDTLISLGQRTATLDAAVVR